MKGYIDLNPTSKQVCGTTHAQLEKACVHTVDGIIAYHHDDDDVRAKMTKSACEKTLSGHQIGHYARCTKYNGGQDYSTHLGDTWSCEHEDSHTAIFLSSHTVCVDLLLSEHSREWPM